jgi:hypothetical protein
VRSVGATGGLSGVILMGSSVFFPAVPPAAGMAGGGDGGDGGDGGVESADRCCIDRDVDGADGCRDGNVNDIDGCVID